ncbi:hypothetical protein LEN26_011660 [Aphanomyces euteiches]|nr:hypothetical protein LEN26_011660 [Aphanomyces euteiches]
MYYYKNVSKRELASLFHKDAKTITNWIKRYEEYGFYERKVTEQQSSYSEAQRRWLIQFVERKPLSFLDEVKYAFEQEFGQKTTISTVWRTMHNHGLTWKVLERRAIHVKESDVLRFVQELGSIDWCHMNVLFLDEASFDNKGMLRRRGYAMKGRKLVYRGEYNRQPRVSLLCWAGVNGLESVYDTGGTFNRAEFVKCCQLQSQMCQMYPGHGSIWILDGARIHCHPDVVYFLRSIGIVPIFLPAYCPFFNPLEYLFGLMKRDMARNYLESKTPNLLLFVMKTMMRYNHFDMSKIYKHCGWNIGGTFDPTRGMGIGNVNISSVFANQNYGANDENVDELLEFVERED